MIHEVPRKRSSRTIAVVGTVAVVAYGLLAIVQIAVLNPLAAVPGVGLAKIQSDMETVGETLGGWWTLMTVGPLIAVAILFRVWRRHHSHPSSTARTYLVMLALGAPAYFFSSFGPGMALADTYLISGGDHSPWSTPLYVVSGLAVIFLTAQLVWNPMRNCHPRSSAPKEQGV